MTKKQLLNKLKNLPDNTPIILASDAEGNSFECLSEVYVEKNLKFDYDDKELVGKDETEMDSWEQFKKDPDVVVLFP